MPFFGWPGKKSLEWIEVIVSERLGHRVRLSLVSEKTLKLEIDGVEGRIEFPLDPLTFNRTDSDLSCTTWSAEEEGWTAAYLPTLVVPGVDKIMSPLIEKTPEGFRIHYDLLGYVYWMLSRCEEVGRQDLDVHGRFSARSSHAFKCGYLERPLVDEWLAILSQVVRRNWPNLRLKKNIFSMKVSHDVDEPSRYAFRSPLGLVRAVAGDLLKRTDVVSVVRAPLVKLTSGQSLSKLDPSNTFSWLMDQSERHGLTSAFYFICGRTDSLKDADYEIEHPAIRHLLRTIHSRGHEIGLHPSYNTYLNATALADETQRLRDVCAEEGIVQNVWGGRMHYLRWSQPTTLAAWDRAGMTYDSTLGYADLPGFRCGTCYEYQGYDLTHQRILNVRVRPLIVMDVTITGRAYLGLGTGPEGLEVVELLKSSCRSVGGVFTLLWHNSNLTTPKERDFYSNLLE